MLFRQPTFSDTIDKYFSVAGVIPNSNPIGAFYIKQNQPNPFRADSNDVPVAWNVGDMTGFYPTGNGSDYQRGIFNERSGTATGRTAAQVQGGVVGAYLRSADLENGSLGHKMMIAPNYKFRTPYFVPFASASSLMTVSVDLQVPVATDGHSSVSNTYVVIDLLLTHRTTGRRVVYHAGVFGNNQHPIVDGINFDTITRTVILGGVVADFSRYLTVLPGSARYQSAPWRGWQTFAYSMSQNQFGTALIDASRRYPTKGISTNPASYELTQWHLNAELHYRAYSPATLGWSMQNAVITAS